MRSQIPLVLLLCLCSAALAQDYAFTPRDGEDESWIVLEGDNNIQMPKASFSSLDANWTYPFRYFPIYAENQSISGIILCPASLAGKEARICISSFSIFDLLSTFQTQDQNSENETTIMEGNCTHVRLNETGDARFALEGASSGLYTIKAVDALNSTVLAATPTLIAKGEIVMNYSSEIAPGDILPVEIETLPTLGNKNENESESRVYGAIMIPSQDYDTARISLAVNDTVESLITTIALGNSSTRVQGLPEVSSALLMNILTLLPQNSGVAYQESAEEKVELYIFTESTWAKGEYILTCAVYSQNDGLIGMGQGIVEVV